MFGIGKGGSIGLIANPIVGVGKRRAGRRSNSIIDPLRNNQPIFNTATNSSSEEIMRGQLTSPHLVALEYADLNLKHTIDIQEVGGHVRIRQHVNPLSSTCLTPARVPDWREVFRDTTLPLMVDIGSGRQRSH